MTLQCIYIENFSLTRNDNFGFMSNHGVCKQPLTTCPFYPAYFEKEIRKVF